MNSFKRAIMFAVCTCVAVMPSLRAEDLGQIGPVHPIIERNAIEVLQQKMKRLQASGKIAKLQSEARQRAEFAAKNPTPVNGLVVVQKESERLIDPTVTYNDAIRGDQGEIIVPAGTRINPLQYQAFSKRIVFFDGRDLQQAEAVRKMVATYGAKIKPVLVAGNWFDLAKAWKTQVYFDQHGTLVKRWGIRAVPSVVEQRGQFLVIKEIPAKALT
jgi:conjugal transfer pilus assembly protein TraW